MSHLSDSHNLSGVVVAVVFDFGVVVFGFEVVFVAVFGFEVVVAVVFRFLASWLRRGIMPCRGSATKCGQSSEKSTKQPQPSLQYRKKMAGHTSLPRSR